MPPEGCVGGSHVEGIGFEEALDPVDVLVVRLVTGISLANRSCALVASRRPGPLSCHRKMQANQRTRGRSGVCVPLSGGL